MTWKEFKELVEAHGVKDDTKINLIDFYNGGGPRDLEIDVDEHEATIWERR